MPAFETSSDLLDRIKSLYMSDSTLRYAGQAAGKVLKELSPDDLRAVVDQLLEEGITIMIPRDEHPSVALDSNHPSFVMLEYLARHFSEALRDDPDASRIAQDRSVSHSAMRIGDMNAGLPMPVMGADGEFYIPDPDAY